MKEIEQIAEEHSIKDLGRVSPAYQLGFTQGAKYLQDKTFRWLIRQYGDMAVANQYFNEMTGE